ncbi:hypothetical protein D3C87_1674540 [compost metagenome]|uniref:hypothetical protein n=1 Tax=Enterobacter hormaechei TaxID=158836 RepID=UPI000FB83261|nr:hypothetical protein [Enterobacter hormaechei]MBT1926906.1 hypothetical protein [Enterobacter hormaechei subsp. hoffmannii]MBT1931710.1 hypothetical protein [Enterobacter hormaechei subsp. hoffmannii]MBT1955322.1 hypothetical protein [Enterobacter hormaechei subsp. hoffmannii]MBT1960069.1 hypothetical protein [Enterobacter hormaechei subsp. hoffmannii]MBT1969909.1 hypothetical protein [Enterobacter hormaechei subsp. hoffmannii]
MPITIQEINEHYDQFGHHDMSTMPIAEYQQALVNGALFWIDHHDFVRSTLSEEILATNKEQLDAMIEHLQQYRNRMHSS